ncbi:MAG: putative geopeptide radical SAM maturase [Nitrospirae bacterium]|nr:MAG: putative geopeptide radical SAM maturase [Nitrospirota bacterium]
MILSKYCKTYSDEDPESLLLFSTKNSAIVQVPKGLLKEIEEDDLSEEDEITLKELGFLIDNPEAERTEMLGFLDEINSLNTTLSIRLVMNLDCNLACRYCFEGTRKGKFYMSGETADRAVEFVKARISERGDGLEELYITFYGGEPLLSSELIVYVSKRLKALAADRGLNYRFSLMTNGTMLTGKLAAELKPLGLKDAYITIDGPQDLHDNSRPFKGGGGSFEAITRNLKDISGIIDVFVGGNFTKPNFRRFPELLDHMINAGLTPEKLRSLQFYPVVDENAEFALPDFHDGLATFNEPWLFEATLSLREEILKRGFKVARISTGGCMLEYGTDIIINYDGGICRCPGFIGMEQFRDGDIFSGMLDFSHSQGNWKNEKCLDCAYLPLCFGGCRYMKYVREGNMDGVDCQKSYFDATLEAFVKQDIKYGLV